MTSNNTKVMFTDKRIASLIGSIASCILNSDAVSFIEGGQYKWELNFTVKDESLIVGANGFSRKKIGVDNGVMEHCEGKSI